MKDASRNMSDFDSYIYSTTAARLNGYVGGYGDSDLIEKELDSYGLSDKGKKILRDIAKKGLRTVCPVPVN